MSQAPGPVAANDSDIAYSSENWAHQALLQMDEAMTLVNWASVSLPDVPRYYRGMHAFNAVAQMLRTERERLEEVLRKPASSEGGSAS